MNSYISSFRALLAALAIIGFVEFGYSAVDNSSPVERSTYVNFNYNSDELFHKGVIYEKLLNAVRDRPDIIQIGDSSGFHAIVPRIVDKYLGSLKYENLSCCANTLFDGYYTIADFMFRHVPSIKAVVLYITLNGAPGDPARIPTAVVGGDDRLRNAFGPLAPLTSPPTLAARLDVVAPIYTLGHRLNQPGIQSFDDMWPELTTFLRTHRGWWSEHDPHLTAEKQRERMSSFCPQGILPRNDSPSDYTYDVFGDRQSWMRVELRRLAALTARHQAKLILLFQPYPCSMVGNYVDARRADVASVQADYPNLVVPHLGLLESWPVQWFSTMDHLRTGHEDAASRRAARAIARALGLPAVELPQPPGTKDAVSVWSSADFTTPAWRAEGFKVAAQPDGKGAIATETADAGRHYVETTLPDMSAETYVVSVTFRMTGPRRFYLEVQSRQPPGDYNRFSCSVAVGDSWRSMGMSDSGLDELADHVFRCWGKFRLTKAGANIVRIGLAPAEPETTPYKGDGKSNVALYSVELSAVDGADAEVELR
jgi:hypothetical protein